MLTHIIEQILNYISVNRIVLVVVLKSELAVCVLHLAKDEDLINLVFLQINGIGKLEPLGYYIILGIGVNNQQLRASRRDLFEHGLVEIGFALYRYCGNLQLFLLLFRLALATELRVDVDTDDEVVVFLFNLETGFGYHALEGRGLIEDMH